MFPYQSVINFFSARNMNLITHSLFIIIISLVKTRNPCKLSLTRVILFFVPRPGTRHRNHRKIKEFIFLIINYLHLSYFLHFCPHFLLFSTLLVHFEIPFSFVPLQYRKTKENQSFSVITRLWYLNRDKTSKQWQS